MIILKKIDTDTKQTELRMNVDEISWPEVTDQFVHFLQGCGYVVQGIDIAEHLMGQYAFQKQEKEQCQKKVKSKK